METVVPSRNPAALQPVHQRETLTERLPHAATSLPRLQCEYSKQRAAGAPMVQTRDRETSVPVLTRDLVSRE